MTSPATLLVVSKDGARGTAEVAADASGDRVRVAFDGRLPFWAAREALRPRNDGAFDLDVGTSDLAAAESFAIPVVREELEVGKRVVETGRVVVIKDVHTRDETVSVPLARENAVVERVLIGRVVTSMPGVRHEGDVTIVPVVEEVVVVTKQLVLKEEIRITTTRTIEPSAPQTVTLREEVARVERNGVPERGERLPDLSRCARRTCAACAFVMHPKNVTT